MEVNTGSGLVFTLLFGDKLRLHRSISTRLGRGTLKKENRLPWIEPGETKDMEVEIGVLEGMPEIEGFSARIREVLEQKGVRHG